MIGSVVAPVWGPTGGGSAMDEGEGRKKFLRQVRKGCRIARRLRELGARPYGVVRIDSACSPRLVADPAGNQAKIAETFRQAGAIARDFGERLAAEGEICWGGMHSWRTMVDLLERVGEPETVASRPTWRTRSFTRWAKTPRRIASCPRISTGKTRRCSMRPWKR